MKTSQKISLSVLYILLFFGGLWSSHIYSSKGHWQVSTVLLLSLSAASILYSFLYFWNESRFEKIVRGRLPIEALEKVEKRRKYITWYWVLLGTFLQFFVFAALFQLFDKFSGQKHFSFKSTITYTDWLLYTVDCAFKSVLDIPEIFHLHIRNIKPLSFQGKTTVALVRLFIYSLFVATIIKQFKKWSLTRETIHSLPISPQIALRRLLRLGPEALPMLESMLAKSDLFASFKQAGDGFAMDEFTKPLEQTLLKNLRVGNKHQRKNAVVLLGFMNIHGTSTSKLTSEMFHQAQNETNEEVIGAILDTLTKMMGSDSDRYHRYFLRSEMESVRLRAIENLVENGSKPSAFPIYQAIKKDKDATHVLRKASIQAIGSLGAKKMIEKLHLWLEHESDMELCAELNFAIVKLGDLGVLTQIGEYLEADDPVLVLAAVEACISVGKVSSIEPLLSLLEHKDENVRARVLHLLFLVDGTVATEEVLKRGYEVFNPAQVVSFFRYAPTEEMLLYFIAVYDSCGIIAQEKILHSLFVLGCDGAKEFLLGRLSGESSEDEKMEILRGIAENHWSDAIEVLEALQKKESSKHIQKQIQRTALAIS